MKLVYSREGGLFPQVAQTEVEATDLPTDLQELAGTILSNPKAYASSSDKTNLRDGYLYRLDLREGSKKVNLAYDDLSLPDDLMPLINFLQQRTGKP